MSYLVFFLTLAYVHNAKGEMRVWAFLLAVGFLFFDGSMALGMLLLLFMSMQRD